MSVEGEKQPKQKLTLAMDKDIIEKAKNAGINISAITEKLLESVTLDVKGATREDVIKGYGRFFDVIMDVLKKYKAEMHVGFDLAEEEGGELVGLEIVLNQYGLFIDNIGSKGKHPVKIEEVEWGLLDPFEILENLLRSLISAAEKNREQLKELEIALRFVKALSSDGDRVVVAK